MNTIMRSLLPRLCVITFCITVLVTSRVYAVEISLKAGLPPFPPFAYPNAQQERGSIVDIYRMLEKELGTKIVIHYYPYPRVIQSMKNGELDIAIIFKNKGLESFATFVGEVSKSNVLVIPNKGFFINRYEDLYKLKSIAVLRLANFEPRFDADTRLNKYTVVDYTSGLRMMNVNRASAIVGSQSGLAEANKNLSYDANRWNPPYLLNKKEWWLHMSKKSPHQALIPELQKAIQKIYREDLVWQLYNAPLTKSIVVDQ